MTERYNTGNPRPSNSMKDLNDNALAYDDFLNSDEEDAVDRLQRPFPTVRKQVAARINEIIGAQQDAEVYAKEAKQSADNAQNIADANTYYITPTDPDGTIAGLAGTPSGQGFRVAQGPGNGFKYFRNDSGVAVEIAAVSGAAVVSEIINRVPELEIPYHGATLDKHRAIGAGLRLSDMHYCAPFFESGGGNILDTVGSVALTITSSAGKITLSDSSGHVIFEIDTAGNMKSASLRVLSFLADIANCTVPDSGGFGGNAVNELVSYVGLKGRASQYGNKIELNPGVATRRLGTVIAAKPDVSWMSGQVESPQIWRDPDQLFHMVFTAYSGSLGKPGVGSIGHATSHDLINWSIDAQPLLQGSGNPAAPDKSGCTGPYMVLGDDGRYYLFYIGLPEDGYEQGVKRLCLAVADSLAGSWERKGVMVDINKNAPWRSSDVYHPSIVERNGMFYMFINGKGGSKSGSGDTHGNERIGLAVSHSLSGPWIVDDENSPLITTVNGTWESQKVADPSVYRDEGQWYMSYFGYNGTTACDSVAVTSDKDFPYGWRKIGFPTLQPNKKSVNESIHAHKPYILFVGGRKFHFYTGVGTNSRSICVAVSGAAVDNRFAPDSDGNAINIITPSLAGGEAVINFTPELSTMPVLRVGQDSAGAFNIYRDEQNGFKKNNGIRFNGDSVAIGNELPIPATATTGFVYLPAVSGPPTSIPNAIPGCIPVCIDPASGKIYRFTNGAWVS